MRRIGCLLVIAGVATVTYIRCVDIIPFMAGKAICRDAGMGPVQLVIIIVDREECRLPVRFCSVTCLTGGRDCKLKVAGVYRFIKIDLMTFKADCWRPAVTV